MFVLGFPLLLIPFAIYNIIAFITPGVSWTATVTTVHMMSGQDWVLTWEDIIVGFAILLLAVEIIAQDVCMPGYSKRVRNVPQAEKQQAYREYGIAVHRPHAFEIDHLIPLELGGSNSIRNLWPQSYRTRPWNAARCRTGTA